MPLLEARALTRRFGGFAALDAVDFSAEAGEIHAVVGANGAGKSTLMNVFAGVLSPSAGEVRLGGEPVRFGSPREARAAGLSVVFQELTVLPALSVAENVLLGREPRLRCGLLDRRALRERTADLLREHGLPLDPDAPAGSLSVAGQQVVELARALSFSARVLILDEPTSVLSGAERDRLFGIMSGLRAKGILVLFITHRLEEVFAIADRLTVLRNGRTVFTGRIVDTDRDAIVRHMVGHTIADRRGVPPIGAAPPALAARFRTPRGEGRLELRQGEIVGLAGVVGSGRTFLARTLAGLEPACRVEYTIEGRTLVPSGPRQAMAAGIVYLTEDRKRDGLFLNRSCVENATAGTLGAFSTAGVLDRGAERDKAGAMLDRLRLIARSLEAPVRELSGGNQQKVLFARALLGAPRLLVCDEPTRGIDVGAKEEIYDTLIGLAGRGMAIVIVSSEFKELLALCHRLVVLSDGAIRGELPPTAGENDVLRMALPA